VRRALILSGVLAALAVAAQATAALEPVRRDFGESHVDRVRSAAGYAAPARRARGRVRVLVRLRSAPLAAWAGRTTAAATPRRLDVRAPAARSYLAALAAEQRAAAAEIRREVAGAAVGRRFRVLVNALTVELPARSLAKLGALDSVTRVYPSIRYTLRTNRSPGLIGATAFESLTGSRGEGIKIAIVDDGVDISNPFFDPVGFTFPEGFPRGQRRFTTEKVIVAKSFAAPGTPPRSRRAFDTRNSAHGSHVAGIAAGNGATTAASGSDHPETTGLSGVAPRAWIGNYRVFNLPTPVGDVANTPEIVAAFEEAVKDGMDVVNFSGGGFETEPANDALVEVIANVAAAGVVPVIAAGNERDDFGPGSVGSPGTAPAGIAVAAVSDSHVFGPALSVEGYRDLPFSPGGGELPPESWAVTARELVDVTTVTGTDGRPVDSHLCGLGADPNGGRNPLAANSLKGAVLLVARGYCTFASKGRRARRAGAAGLVIVDNRAGEANFIPVDLGFPAMMIADLDGTGLRAYLATRGGRAPMRAGRTPFEFVTDRGGVVTSFSSGGPTAFGHRLKPDLAAPGGAILSSTNPDLTNSPFAVFDGTSMAAPHVAGAAAILLQRHPGWSAEQIKSALTSTAGTAWANTARTSEAPVTLAGGGLVDLGRADDPRIFTSPTSLSFGDVDVSGGARSASLIVAVDDAGGGAGEWAVGLHAQSSIPGVEVSVPATVAVPGFFRVVVSARADASAGEAYGFVVLSRDGVERRVPYHALFTRPGLAGAPAKELARFQLGTTARGKSRASLYRYPGNPFGQPPAFGVAPPMVEDGAEGLYRISLDLPAVNFGVAAVEASAGAVVDPFVLGSLDESDVQGGAGTPVNVNGLSDLYTIRNGAAGVAFPRVGRYWVSVDSGRDEFTNRRLAGRYVLRAWIDDLAPPAVVLETRTVFAGRPVIAARFLDGGSGVDPLSLVVVYRDTAVGAAYFDPASGLALFPLPPQMPALEEGQVRLLLVGSDWQESKNVQSVGVDVFPNTAFVERPLHVTDDETVVNWLTPAARSCVDGRVPLVVAAGGPRRIRAVRFLDGDRRLGVVRRREQGIWTMTWRAGRASEGRHRLRAVAVDAAGAETTAARTLRVCR
jgi:subtilisin family serine protease